jgi:hypothetical protein
MFLVQKVMETKELLKIKVFLWFLPWFNSLIIIGMEIRDVAFVFSNKTKDC